ncbi:carbohydrate-binding module family 13 protein [Suillus luteus UH-Slu-Lm8-n1]|uniref:Carbohydrate-binding module family 13 protein n=1 Tax=Suillus luteus UH-Slu-Lm8-n1 TaxID=930992 RepID=A0A0D0B3B9_9AGAM|nr:carbohydrate-binding module family 13 protein [Suillus luteus UH-Slu-Lm8-n1]
MACIQNQHIYTLRNCQGGTVIDLSGGDNYSIIGYHDHNGPNQAWIFQQEHNGWFIKSVGADKYLGIEGEVEDAGNGTKVVASSTPCKWDVTDSDVEGVSGIRILLHGKKFSVDLSDKGNATEGTPIQLWSRWHGANQIWALIERNW